ncbi:MULTISPECIES: autotransporter outer membrane beta-barrel domain-containing protein, partial [unclassified Pantoea]|uniref:autotransporter outer membrane beta-barrel domain-containing protein n=1 Tax=unclassified Pantoea TaxID=2630326 RepID=UPI002555B89B
PVNPHAVRMVRPEAGAYAANLQGSRDLFTLSLHDRAGTSLYTDPVTGETHATSMWLRNEGGRSVARLADGQNRTAANRYVMQLGGDVAAWESDAAGRLSAGVMGGYANQQSTTRNGLTGHDAKGSVDGYSAGLYATWYQNPADKSGMYMDGWLQYGRFNNEVKGKDLAPETYKSRGLGASVETGYSWRLLSLLSSEGTEGSFWLQPHAQVLWTGVRADDHTERNGTRVQGTGSDGVETKLGMRAFLRGKSAKDAGTAREFEPFVEANWIYQTDETGVRMNGAENHLAGVRNAGELKAGVEGQLTKNLSLDVSVAQQMAGKGYSDTAGVLGMKVSF